MVLSVGLFQSHSSRRRKTIDPAHHFAVRVRGKYAMPITREYFAGIISNFDRQAATLKRIAALGRKQAKRTLKTGERGEGPRENLKRAHERAMAINSGFEDFIRPLVFTDHSTHHTVARTKMTLHRASQEIGDAIRLIDASYRDARDRGLCAARRDRP